MKMTLVSILMGISFTCKSQLYISGQITPSDQWERIIYINRIDHINLAPIELVDSVRLAPDGHFSYQFKMDTSGGLIYKLSLPPKGGNHLSSISGSQDNYLYITTEETDSLTILANSDSLYYSARIKGGVINRELLKFRDHSRPFSYLSRAWEDSARRHPAKLDHYNKRFRVQWMNEIEEFKKRITLTLDTATRASTIIVGLCNLNSAYLGILPSDVIKKYISRIPYLDIPIVRNTIALAESTETNRRGLLLPNLSLEDPAGGSHSLHNIAKHLTVIDFWASWCNPCRQANRDELPELYEQFRKDSDKQIISISIDRNQEQWKKAMDADGVTWPQYIDNSRAFANLLSVHAVPLYLVLDEQKRIIYETISIYHLKHFLSNMDRP